MPEYVGKKVDAAVDQSFSRGQKYLKEGLPNDSSDSRIKKMTESKENCKEILVDAWCDWGTKDTLFDSIRDYKMLSYANWNYVWLKAALSEVFLRIHRNERIEWNALFAEAEQALRTRLGSQYHDFDTTFDFAQRRKDAEIWGTDTGLIQIAEEALKKDDIETPGAKQYVEGSSYEKPFSDIAKSNNIGLIRKYIENKSDDFKNDAQSQVIKAICSFNVSPEVIHFLMKQIPQWDTKKVQCTEDGSDGFGIRLKLASDIARALGENDVVERLMQVRAVNYNPREVWLEAAQYGQRSIVNWLIVSNRNNVYTLDKFGINSLEDLFLTKDSDGNTAFMLAAENGHSGVIQELSAYRMPGSDFYNDVVKVFDSSGNSVWAIEYNNDGKTALQIAIQHDDKDIVGQLSGGTFFYTDFPPMRCVRSDGSEYSPIVWTQDEIEYFFNYLKDSKRLSEILVTNIDLNNLELSDDDILQLWQNCYRYRKSLNTKNHLEKLLLRSDLSIVERSATEAPYVLGYILDTAIRLLLKDDIEDSIKSRAELYLNGVLEVDNATRKFDSLGVKALQYVIQYLLNDQSKQALMEKNMPAVLREFGYMMSSHLDDFVADQFITDNAEHILELANRYATRYNAYPSSQILFAFLDKGILSTTDFLGKYGDHEKINSMFSFALSKKRSDLVKSLGEHALDQLDLSPRSVVNSDNAAYALQIAAENGLDNMADKLLLNCENISWGSLSPQELGHYTKRIIAMGDERIRLRHLHNILGVFNVDSSEFTSTEVDCVIKFALSKLQTLGTSKVWAGLLEYNYSVEALERKCQEVNKNYKVSYVNVLSNVLICALKQNQTNAMTEILQYCDRYNEQSVVDKLAESNVSTVLAIAAKNNLTNIIARILGNTRRSAQQVVDLLNQVHSAGTDSTGTAMNNIFLVAVEQRHNLFVRTLCNDGAVDKLPFAKLNDKDRAYVMSTIADYKRKRKAQKALIKVAGAHPSGLVKLLDDEKHKGGIGNVLWCAADLENKELIKALFAFKNSFPSYDDWDLKEDRERARYVLHYALNNGYFDQAANLLYYEMVSISDIDQQYREKVLQEAADYNFRNAMNVLMQDVGADFSGLLELFNDEKNGDGIGNALWCAADLENKELIKALFALDWFPNYDDWDSKEDRKQAQYVLHCALNNDYFGQAANLLDDEMVSISDIDQQYREKVWQEAADRNFRNAMSVLMQGAGADFSGLLELLNDEKRGRDIGNALWCAADLKNDKLIEALFALDWFPNYDDWDSKEDKKQAEYVLRYALDNKYFGQAANLLDSKMVSISDIAQEHQEEVLQAAKEFEFQNAMNVLMKGM